jgi:hypothetical protein
VAAASAGSARRSSPASRTDENSRNRMSGINRYLAPGRKVRCPRHPAR